MNKNTKNNYSGKNIKQHKKISDNKFNLSNTNSSNKRNSYMRNSAKKMVLTIQMKVIKRKVTFHCQKEQIKKINLIKNF